MSKIELKNCHMHTNLIGDGDMNFLLSFVIFKLLYVSFLNEI